MATAEELVEQGRAARTAGRTADALSFYSQAAELYRTDADLARWAHALRHVAELQLEKGDGMAALENIAAVFEFYEKNGAEPLELANTFRVGALAHEAVGEPWKAERTWLDVLEIYTAEAVQAGVDEALAHLKALGVG